MSSQIMLGFGGFLMVLGLVAFMVSFDLRERENEWVPYTSGKLSSTARSSKPMAQIKRKLRNFGITW